MKKLKDFINQFDLKKPDWSSLPEGFPDCQLEGLSSQEVGKFVAIKTLWELQKPSKIKSRSRVWQDPQGYQSLAVWQNAALLRILIRKFTKKLPRSEERLRIQINDAALSVKRNIEEGWKRPTTSEYLRFLGYSQASLEELKGDIRDCKTDGFLPSKPGSSLKDKGFDLRVVKGPRRVKGEPTEPNHPYYRPLKNLKPEDLSFEMFLELINKTEWLLRKLVESLEKKLDNEIKGYQIERARIESKILQP